jgi:hypothetical protein
MYYDALFQGIKLLTWVMLRILQKNVTQNH